MTFHGFFKFSLHFVLTKLIEKEKDSFISFWRIDQSWTAFKTIQCKFHHLRPVPDIVQRREKIFVVVNQNMILFQHLRFNVKGFKRRWRRRRVFYPSIISQFLKNEIYRKIAPIKIVPVHLLIYAECCPDWIHFKTPNPSLLNGVLIYP